jgi:hypothetical protein
MNETPYQFYIQYFLRCPPVSVEMVRSGFVICRVFCCAKSASTMNALRLSTRIGSRSLGLARNVKSNTSFSKYTIETDNDGDKAALLSASAVVEFVELSRELARVRPYRL